MVPPPADPKDPDVRAGTDVPPMPEAIAHYRILRLLGAGGMGQVFLAQDTRLDRPVALKVLPREMAKDQERMRRFAREARAASGLSHPGVAQVHDVGEADGVHYIVMEHVDGESLHARLKGGPSPPRRPSGSPSRWRTPSTTPISRASSIATSNRRTS